MADRNALMSGYGGVLDQLGIVPRAEPTPERNGLMDWAGQVFSVPDQWAIGIPSTLLGLASPITNLMTMPFGAKEQNFWTAKDNAETARSDLARQSSLGRDLLALPEAYGGMVPGGVGHYAAPGNARALADTSTAGARQAGRAAESLIDPVYNAMPDNAVGMAGGKLSPPPGITNAEAPRPEPRGLQPQGLSNEASQVLAETGTRLPRPNPRAQASQAAEALRSAFGRDFDIMIGGSAAGDSAYIRTPFGDIRFSDHAAGFRPGQAFDFYGHDASPDAVVSWYRDAQARSDNIVAKAQAVAAAEREARLLRSQPQRAEEAANRAAKETFWRDNGLDQATATAKEKAWKQYKRGEFNNSPPPGIKAYHGSPHDFDRFSMDKIGTGEGAQAYGHGLYFAESEGVARSYRDKLKKTTVDGNPYSSKSPEGIAAQADLFSGGDVGKARKYLQDNINFEGHPRELRDLHKQALDLIEAKGFPTTLQDPGRLYEVRINANPDDFLDWDKPLSQQSEKVMSVAGSLIGKPAGASRMLDEKFLAAPTKDGNVQYQAGGDRLVRELGLADPKKLSDTLRDAGIPGIKYLDQGSRTSGEGTRNYVVFRDDIIDIVRKYGIAAAASMYGMDQVSMALSDPSQSPPNPLMQGY